MKQRKTSAVTWEDPPLTTAYDWEAIAEDLRSNPGQWAKVFEQDRTSYVVSIRSGSVRALRPEDGFEVKTRDNKLEPVRTCTLYMRYNPEKEVR